MESKEKLEVVRKLQGCGIMQYRLALEEVEKDLERLEQIDNAKPSEALKAFERLNEDDSDYALKRATKDIEIVKQALLKAQEKDKILEIIFKKNVDIIHLDVSRTVEDYNHLENVGDDLTQEEFDLLKEKRKEVLDSEI